MPTNAKNSVYKKKEFEIYVLWKSLPAHIKGMSKNDLKSFGFIDPLSSKIIKIKNQTEFAKYFHIKDLGTLTDWNSKIKKENVTPSFLITDIKKQFSNINQQITLPNISKLKNKIYKLNKIISSLKKENAELQKKLKLRVSNKKEKTIKSTTDPREITSPIKSEIGPPEDKVAKTIFQKFKNLFQK